LRAKYPEYEPAKENSKAPKDPKLPDMITFAVKTDPPIMIAHNQAYLLKTKPHTNEEIRIAKTVMPVSSQFLEVSIIASKMPVKQTKMSVIQNFTETFMLY
jgi:hypothetical protein